MSGKKTEKRTVVPFDPKGIVAVKELPPRTHGDTLAKQVLEALGSKKGIFKVREYTSSATASAFARSLNKSGLTACTRKDPQDGEKVGVFVTVA